MKLPKLKNPFRALKSLRLEVAKLKGAIAFLENRLAGYKGPSARFIQNNIPNEDAARSCLMQLRVHGMSDGRGRTGYGVTAFIPEEVLAGIREHNMAVEFTRVVADELVRRALSGAHHVNSRGAVSALLFEPLVPGKPLGAMGAVFDTPYGTQIVRGRKPGDSDAEYRRAEELAAERMLAARDSRPLLPREAESDL